MDKQIFRVEIVGANISFNGDNFTIYHERLFIWNKGDIVASFNVADYKLVYDFTNDTNTVIYYDLIKRRGRKKKIHNAWK